MQDKIFEALDCAVRNGYEIESWEDQDIADDMIIYDADFENATPDELIPFIQMWKQSQ